MFKSILVPVDGSQHAQQALSVACHLLSEHDGALHLFHVPEPVAHETLLVWGIGAVPLESDTQERRQIGEQLLARATEAAREQGVTHIESRLGSGDPARAILDQAEACGADAIVMGSRGLGNIKGLVVGSVSHKVAHAADCSVVTVR